MMFTLKGKPCMRQKQFARNLEENCLNQKILLTIIKFLHLPKKKGVSYFWIGISDETTEGEFTYESNGKKIGYKNWSGGEPNNSGNNEDCVMGGWGYGKWNDINCGSKYSFVCEKLPPGN